MSPVTQTSFVALPRTPVSFTVVLTVAGDHAVPFQCKSVGTIEMRSYFPAAHTSFGPFPQRPLIFCVVPLADTVHVEPS